MRLLGVLVLSFAPALLLAQQGPEQLLLRARGRVLDTIHGLPRYLCTQTIDRERYEVRRAPAEESCQTEENGTRLPPPTELFQSDRLRLDVMTASLGHELYSWTGENRFSDRSLGRIVTDGAASTGSFAAFLTAIFDSEDATLFYEGSATENGRELATFNFEIPLEKSRYRFGARGDQVLTGYEGSFVVDAQTADLLRLTVRTAELPRSTGICRAETVLQYTRTRLRQAEVLLPAEARLRITHPDGSENVNRIVFSGCHEFPGESNLRLDLPDAPVQAVSAPGVPSGRPFRLAFAEDIDPATAAAGDRVHAVLATPITDGSNVLVPKGAAIAGRIVRVEQNYVPTRSLTIVVKLDSLESPGAAQPLPARVKCRFPDPPSGFVVKRGLETEWVTLGP